MQIGPWIPCQACNVPLVAGPAQIYGYLESFPAEPSCPECGEPIDWWKTVISALERNFFFTKALELAGAQTTILTKPVHRNEPLDVDFVADGIPAAARILAVNMTPHGALFPAQIRQSYFDHDHIPHKFTIFPTALRNQEAPERAELSVMVTWYVADEDIGSRNLFDALHAFAVETRVDQLTTVRPDWSRVVVPASQAVEFVIGRFVTEALKKQNIPSGRFNYATALSPILPMISTLLNAPVLPPNVARALDRLRAVRNVLIHEGATKEPIERVDAATLLAGALFGYHYIAAIRSRGNI